jgi:hypothetical protein
LLVRDARCGLFVDKVKVHLDCASLWQRRPGYHPRIMGQIGDLTARALNRAGYLITLARLTILGWLVGPFPEVPTDTAVREQDERLREAFPQVEFDDPRRHVR